MVTAGLALHAARLVGGIPVDNSTCMMHHVTYGRGRMRKINRTSFASFFSDPKKREGFRAIENSIQVC